MWIVPIAQCTTEFLSFLIKWSFQMEGSDFRSELFKEKFYNVCYFFRHKSQPDYLCQWILSCRARLLKKHWLTCKCLASNSMYVHCSWDYLSEPNISWPMKKIPNQVLRDLGGAIILTDLELPRSESQEAQLLIYSTCPSGNCGERNA